MCTLCGICYSKVSKNASEDGEFMQRCPAQCPLKVQTDTNNELQQNKVDTQQCRSRWGNDLSRKLSMRCHRHLSTVLKLIPCPRAEGHLLLSLNDQTWKKVCFLGLKICRCPDHHVLWLRPVKEVEIRIHLGCCKCAVLLFSLTIWTDSPRNNTLSGFCTV